MLYQSRVPWVARIILALVAATLFSLNCSLQCTHAQGIALESIEPRGAQRGNRFTISLSGERLDQARQVLFYRPGLRLVEIKAQDEETAEATLESDVDCPLGEHPFVLWGASGVSKLATLRVGPYNVATEKEPNDTNGQPHVLDKVATVDGITLVGELEGADVDCFLCQLDAGQRLSADLEAMRLGGQFLDAYLEVLAPDGKLLVSSDDTPLLKQDPSASITATEAGNYTIRVRDAAFDAEYGSRYRLHLGGFARPTIAYPCGGLRGESTDITLIGDARGDIPSQVAVPHSGAGIFDHYPSDGEGGLAPTPIRFRASDLANVLETEPNDTPAQVTLEKQPSMAFNGILSKHDDVDHFRFSANAGQQFDVEVFGSRVGSPIDSVIEILGPDGRQIALNDDGIVHDSSLRFVALESGEYCLKVADHLNRGGADYVYRVEFQPVQASMDLRIADLDPLQPLSLPRFVLPQGGRYAVLASARRKNFAGTVELAASALPEGVTLSVEPIDGKEHLSMLLFEADETATVSTQLTEITAYCSSDLGAVTGTLRQQVGLVFGEPRQTVYHDTEVDRLPLCVTEPAPFSIDVIQPQASLVQDGLQELRVVAERREGFDEPIEVTALLLPKWIETSEDVATIEAGRSEGIYPLISNQPAEPGTYPMILIGKAFVDGGEVRVASQKFLVTVARPHAEVAIAPVATEQGTKANLECKISWLRDVPGKATATLRGLPNHASAPKITLDRDTKSFRFPISVAQETPASIHNTLFVELSVPESGEPCRQYLGRGGTLEVFEQGQQASEKRSRLEILRQNARSVRMTKMISVP